MINDKITDENTRIMNLKTKISWQRSDTDNQQEKIIEDELTVQLEILSTDIQKINRKEINNEESDKSDTE